MVFARAVHISQAKIGPGGPLFTPDQLSRDRPPPMIKFACLPNLKKLGYSEDMYVPF